MEAAIRKVTNLRKRVNKLRGEHERNEQAEKEKAEREQQAEDHPTEQELSRSIERLERMEINGQEVQAQ